MFKKQWNLDDIADKEDNNDNRDAEAPGDTNTGAREQGTVSEEIRKSSGDATIEAGGNSKSPEGQSHRKP